MDFNAISSYSTAALTSVKQALAISVMDKAMKHDAQSIEGVIKTMEQSVTPYKGQNIDIKL